MPCDCEREKECYIIKECKKEKKTCKSKHECDKYNCDKKYYDEERYDCDRNYNKYECNDDYDCDEYDCNDDYECDKTIKDDCNRNECNRIEKNKCNKLLYGIRVWADQGVSSITFIPKCGPEIVWDIALDSLSPIVESATVINDQKILTDLFFPLEVRSGDKFQFTYGNTDGNNAFAAAANIDGILYKTYQPTLLRCSKNRIPLKVVTPVGGRITNPVSPLPVTADATSNLVNGSINYVSVIPLDSNPIVLEWTLCF